MTLAGLTSSYLKFISSLEFSTDLFMNDLRKEAEEMGKNKPVYTSGGGSHHSQASPDSGGHKGQHVCVCVSGGSGPHMGSWSESSRLRLGSPVTGRFKSGFPVTREQLRRPQKADPEPGDSSASLQDALRGKMVWK